MKNETNNQKLKPERVQAGATSKLKPERVQAGLTFTVNGTPVDSEHFTFIVDNTVLYPEHVDLGIVTSKLKPERVQAGLTLVAEGFRYVIRGRMVKAIKSFIEAVHVFREVAKDFASFFSFALDIGLTAGGRERLKPERVQAGLTSGGVRSLKPERVQAGLTSGDTSKLKPERVQAGITFTVGGTPVEADRIIVIAGGQEVAPENMRISAVVAKLKPERVQAGFRLAADGLRYAVRGRFRKAVEAFTAAIDTFIEIANDMTSFLEFEIEVVVPQIHPEGPEA